MPIRPKTISAPDDRLVVDPPARARPLFANAVADDSKPKKPLYDVGYGKPPKDKQFKKGQSGNPNGRPRGAKGLNTILRKLLTEKVTIRLPTGAKRVTKIEALLHKLLESGFQGKERAVQLLLSHYSRIVPDDPVQNQDAASANDNLDQHDEAILNELRDLLRTEEEGK